AYTQGLDAVIEAAGYLEDLPDVVFALFGDGPVKAELEELAAASGRTNVRFFPSQPAARMPGLVPCWDLALVIALNRPVIRGALPSKMLEAMAAGVPVL
ncbi:MAG TPA: glycosyltransferase, partial [Gemmatimonadetes bacterium]|nr:glycosyltransferase [Gemmatimonadota bacterium]